MRKVLGMPEQQLTIKVVPKKSEKPLLTESIPDGAPLALPEDVR